MAWNMMRGLDWSGLPVVAEIIGVEDVERFILALIEIREHEIQKREEMKDAITRN